MATRMRPSDAVWVRGENRHNPMMVSAVLWFDQPLDLEALRHDVLAPLVARHPVLRRRIVDTPLRYPRWEDDPTFDLENHLEVTIHGDGVDQHEIERLCSWERSRPIPRDQSPWAVHVHQGYRGGAAMHVRVHHAVGDGMALVQVLLGITDPAPTPATTDTHGVGWRDVGHAAGGAIEGLARRATHPGILVEDARRGADAAWWAVKLLTPALPQRSIFVGHPNGRKRMTWDPDGLPLEEIRAYAHRKHATINDVLLTMTTGALRAYLLERDALVDDVLMMVPINLRAGGDHAPDEDLGNRIGLLPLLLPTGLHDHDAQLATIQARVRTLRESPAPGVSRLLLLATSLLTAPGERLIHRLNQIRSSGVVTNVAGPRGAVELAGARLVGMVGWGGMTGVLDLNGAFVSLDGRIFFGFVSDEAITPDPERLLTLFRDQWRAVRPARRVTRRLQDVPT
jgi:diacylglycerol O-acyltransferase / wax synthase